jgi:hypothetical protein
MIPICLLLRNIVRSMLLAMHDTNILGQKILFITFSDINSSILKSVLLHTCVRLAVFIYDIACNIPYWIDWKKRGKKYFYLNDP